MNESEQERPAKVGKAFDWRLAHIPHQAISLCEITCITHGDHGVVNESEERLTVDVKRSAENKDEIKDPCASQ
jgi:hypothetical protein